MTNPDFFLIGSAEVYAPEFIGVKDILIAGNRIVSIADQIDRSQLGNLDMQYMMQVVKLLFPA